MFSRSCQVSLVATKLHRWSWFCFDLKTFQELQTKSPKKYQALQEIKELTDDSHYVKYKDKLKSINPPCVPFLGKRANSNPQLNSVNWRRRNCITMYRNSYYYTKTIQMFYWNSYDIFDDVLGRTKVYFLMHLEFECGLYRRWCRII